MLPIEGRTETSCADSQNSRTIWDIVWSCLVTIFACTWISMHPNIPKHVETPPATSILHRWRLKFLKQFASSFYRLKLTIFALLAPELVILWAKRQRMAARNLEKQYKHLGWTNVHGFFAIMGGFVLLNGDQAIRSQKDDRPLIIPEGQEIRSRPEDRFKYIGPHGPGEFNISVEHIEDKSKSDVLSKGLVVVQTGWFALQCLARAVERLPITELELSTLAFVILNFATYWLWLHKPYDVQIPFCVNASGTLTGGVDGTTTGGVDDKKVKKAGKDTISFRSFTMLILDYTQVEELTGGKNVPTFYWGSLEHSQHWGAAQFAGIIAVIFGAIHCAAWSFQFPTHEEQILWRTSSLAITCIAAFWSAIGQVNAYLAPGSAMSNISTSAMTWVLRRVLPDSEWGRRLYEETRETYERLMGVFSRVVYIYGWALSRVLHEEGEWGPLRRGIAYARGFGWMLELWAVKFTLWASIALYCLARVTLIVQAFASLRSLPPDANQTVIWTTFIPHV